MNVNNEKDVIYDLFKKYYSRLKLTKIKTISPNYSVYYALSCGLLCLNNKYIVVVVEDDFHKIGDLIELEDIYWVSLQTRTIDNLDFKNKIIESNYENILPPNVMQSKIKLIQKQKDRYVYACNDYPCLQIELLKNKDDRDFAEFGTLHSALETYSCSIKFLI